MEKWEDAYSQDYREGYIAGQLDIFRSIHQLSFDCFSSEQLVLEIGKLWGRCVLEAVKKPPAK